MREKWRVGRSLAQLLKIYLILFDKFHGFGVGLLRNAVVFEQNIEQFAHGVEAMRLITMSGKRGNAALHTVDDTQNVLHD